VTDDKPSPGQPTGWQPQTELEHFIQCPVCGEWFDCRDLGAAMSHLHDGPEDYVSGENGTKTSCSVYPTRGNNRLAGIKVSFLA
jgi:hypothetical protein